MPEVLRLLLQQDVDLLDDLWVGRLREVVLLKLCHSLLAAVPQLVERDDPIQGAILLTRREKVLKLLVEDPLLVLVRLHAVLHLVFILFFPVELLDANQIKSVGQQIVLDLEVESAITCQRWRQVDLDQPGLQVGVQHDVIAEELKAVGAVNAGLLDGVEDLALP